MENRMKDLRQDADLTQQKLAKELGITQRKYSYIETGVQQVSDEVLCRLATFYQTSTDYILKRTNEKKPYPKTAREKRQPR